MDGTDASDELDALDASDVFDEECLAGIARIEQEFDRSRSRDDIQSVQRLNGQVAVLSSKLNQSELEHQTALAKLKQLHEIQLRRSSLETDALRSELDRLRTETDFMRQQQPISPRRRSAKRQRLNTEGFDGGQLKPADRMFERSSQMHIVSNILHFQVNGQRTLIFLAAPLVQGRCLAEALLFTLEQSYGSDNDLLHAVIHTLIELWKLCISSTHIVFALHIARLLSMLMTYCVEVSMAFVAPVLALAQETLDRTQIPRSKGQMIDIAPHEIGIWDLIHALCVFIDPPSLIWSHLEQEFILTALTSQPTPTMSQLFYILPHSVGSNSFGVVLRSQQAQEHAQKVLLDKSSRILFDSRAGSPKENISLCLLICKFLFSVLRGHEVADPTLIRRLIECNSASVNATLERRDSSLQPHSKLVSILTLLLSSFNFNVIGTTSTIYQKHIVTCMRIAFYDAVSVEPFAIEAAKEMLEDMMSMDEAEQVWQAYSER